MPGAAEEAGVGGADGEERARASTVGVEAAAHPVERVPQRRVDRRRRRRVVVGRRRARPSSARSPSASSSIARTSALGLAGQRADVELELDAVGDHVGLRAAVHDRRREGRVRAGVELARHRRRGSSSHSVDEAVGVEQRRRRARAGSPCPRRTAATMSWICVSGWYSAMRRTTSAAFTSALSVRSGCDAWPGVPVHARACTSRCPSRRRSPAACTPAPRSASGMPPDSVIT